MRADIDDQIFSQFVALNMRQGLHPRENVMSFKRRWYITNLVIHLLPHWVAPAVPFYQCTHFCSPLFLFLIYKAVAAHTSWFVRKWMLLWFPLSLTDIKPYIFSFPIILRLSEMTIEMAGKVFIHKTSTVLFIILEYVLYFVKIFYVLAQIPTKL